MDRGVETVGREQNCGAEDQEVLYMLRVFERMLTFRKSLGLSSSEAFLPLRLGLGGTWNPFNSLSLKPLKPCAFPWRLLPGRAGSHQCHPNEERKAGLNLRGFDFEERGGGG